MLDSRRVKLLCAAFFVLGACSALLLVAGTASLFVRHYRAERRALAQPPAGMKPGATPDPVPPWGILEALQIPLVNPGDVLPDRDRRLEKPHWFFENFSESDLSRFLDACDLSPVQKKVLQDRRLWNVTSNGCILTPPEVLVWFLSSEARQHIYSTLAKSPANHAQHLPFRFPLGGFEGEFQASGLPAADIETIRRFTYTNAGSLCFADLQAVQQVFKPSEFDDLVETLYELPAYRLRLRVRSDSDLNSLVKYWGRGGRGKLIAPLLESLSRVPGGASINISHFLPPFARLRLYTYPDSWNDNLAAREDCYFTSMNFFNDTANTNFFDAKYTRQTLDNEYIAITNDPGFGDLVTVLDSGGQSVHMCVYIADDFVFTKNGINPAAPWVLMKLSDMLMMYVPPSSTGHLLFFRRKGMI